MATVTRALLILAGSVLFLPATALAQEPSAPETERLGPYIVVSSVEAGFRGVGVEGDVDKYRSDLNYQPGFRVFESSFRLDSEDSDGPFDKLLFTASGWGGDPVGYLHVNAEKNDIYRFDATVRRFEYFNSLRNLALEQHVADYNKTLGDFKLTLFPGNMPFRLNLGYSMERATDSDSGESRNTLDFSRDEFGIFAPVRVRSDTYTIGFESRIDDFGIAFTQGWRRFKDDTVYYFDGHSEGNGGIVGPGFIDSFRRDEPIRGDSWFTRIGVHGSINERVDVAGRFVYNHAETSSMLFSQISGGTYDRRLVHLDQLLANGGAERPSYLFDVGVTVFATDELTISNTFSANKWNIDAHFDENHLVFQTAPGGVGPFLPSESEALFDLATDYRRFANLFEIDYAFHRRFSAHAGYRYTDRRVERTIVEYEPDRPPDPLEITPEEFDNRTNTFIAGFKARPVNPWTIYFDIETGESDNAFTRSSNYQFTNVRLRNRIAASDTVTVNVSLGSKQNDNPTLVEDEATGRTQEFGVDVKSLNFSASLDWNPSSKFYLGTGYTHSRLSTDAQVIYFFNFARREAVAEYLQRENFAYVNLNAQVHPRIGVFAGGRIHHDRGQGDRRSEQQGILLSSFPYQYLTVEAKVTAKLNDRVDANVGYQYYDYQEAFPNPNLQKYHAHLPYASLRVHFGGAH